MGYFFNGLIVSGIFPISYIHTIRRDDSKRLNVMCGKN